MDWMPIVVLILGVPIALAVWLIVRAIRAGSRIEEISQRLHSLETELFRMKRDKESEFKSEPAPAPPPNIITSAPNPTPIPIVAPQPVISPPRPPAATPPPVFVAPAPPRPAPASSPKTKPAINWEQFMGVKGFAWVGGLALFLGVAFFVKYSFDNNLVPPELRVAIGFLTGLGLLVGGVMMSRKNFPALSQTLCATGVVILYAVTFACRSIYHFEFLGRFRRFC